MYSQSQAVPTAQLVDSIFGWTRQPEFVEMKLDHPQAGVHAPWAVQAAYILVAVGSQTGRVAQAVMGPEATLLGHSPWQGNLIIRGKIAAGTLASGTAVAAAGGTVTLAAVAAAAALLSFYCTHPFRRAAARAAPVGQHTLSPAG